MNMNNKSGGFVQKQAKRARTFFAFHASPHPHIPTSPLLHFFTLLLFAAATGEAAGNLAEMPTIVYRGQLIDGSSGENATFQPGATMGMTFRAYSSDGEDAEPLWTSYNPSNRSTRLTVNVNPDGSFIQALEDPKLIACIVTGMVSHVGVTIGNASMEISPRRMLVPTMEVVRAMRAEGVARDASVGALKAKDLVADRLVVESLQARLSVTGRSTDGVTLAPAAVEVGETTLVKGAEMRVLGKRETVASAIDSPYRGQKLWTADRDGFVLIHTSAGDGRESLRIPGVVQVVRAGDTVRAPTSEKGLVDVEFYSFCQD